MTKDNIKITIEGIWQDRELLQDHRSLILEVIDLLDSGKVRAAEKQNGLWVVNDWVKKSILLWFILNNNKIIGDCFDKIPLKFSGWDSQKFIDHAIRIVPGAVVRYASHIAPGVIVMPSFVNVGAYIDKSTMIDSWATIGSCAQIGSFCHISSGVVIGGVLEPIQSIPVVIEDNSFIGAGSVVTEGVVVKEGAVLGAGLYLSSSTKIVDRETGTISYGSIPPYSVVIPGTVEIGQGIYASAAVIVKTIDEKTRKKTQLNELLRY